MCAPLSFLYYWTKSLAFWYGTSPSCPLAAFFWIFQKFAKLTPLRISGTFRFFKIAGNWPFQLCFIKTAVISFLFVRITRYLVWMLVYMYSSRFQNFVSIVLKLCPLRDPTFFVFFVLFLHNFTLSVYLHGMMGPGYASNT